jgi:hypothetical protein
MMSLLNSLAGIAILTVALAVRGDTVETTDGRRLEGVVGVGEGILIVKTSAGEQRLDGKSVRNVQFSRGVTKTEPRPDKPEKSTPPPGEGCGLLGEYFAGTEFKDLKLSRIDAVPALSFSGFGGPHPSLGRDYSIRWRGMLRGPSTETYTFRAQLAGRLRMWLDGKLVVEVAAPQHRTVDWMGSLREGQKHDVKIEYETMGAARALRLQYMARQRKPSFEAVPTQRLYPPPEAAPPEMRIASPADKSMLRCGETVAVTLEPTDRSGQIAKVELLADDVPVGKLERAPWQFNWKPAQSGNRRVCARATSTSGVTSTTPASTYHVVDTGLPLPWRQMPIGRRQASGSVACEGDVFTLSAREGQLGSEHEAFHFMFQPLTGDGTLLARLESFRGQGGAVAGVMIRESIEGERVRYAMLGMNGGDGLTFMRREKTWEPVHEQDEKASAPRWLRLVRHGRMISASHSSDGRDWQMLGQRELEIAPLAFVGLMICAGKEPASATFDHVSVTMGLEQVEGKVAGALLCSGSFVAGPVRTADETTVRMAYAGRELTIPRRCVARILFHEVSAEAMARIGPGRVGAALCNGDFYEGQVQVKSGTASVNSVLFGSRTFTTYNQIAAALLNGVKETPCRFEVRVTDGSQFRALSLAFEAGKIRIADACGESFTVDASQLEQIRGLP